MLRSTLDSIVKLPRQIPVETGARSKKETEPESFAYRVDPTEKELEKKVEELKQQETSLYPKGYIKYPAYDFF